MTTYTKLLFSLLLAAAPLAQAQQTGTRPGAYRPPPPRSETYRPTQTAPVHRPPPPIETGQPMIRPYDDWSRPNPDAFDWTGISLGGAVGTLGLGAEGTFYLTDWANFRLGAHYGTLVYKTTTRGIDYEYDYSALTSMWLIDLYPGFHRNFRFSAGALLKATSVSLDGQPRRSMTFGDRTYTPEQIGGISGKATFDTFSPYIGIGFGNPVRPDQLLQFSFDMGLTVQDYSLRLDADNPKVSEAAMSRLRSDVSKKIDWLKIYPIISFSISYHF